jgi:beta-phosphoglucomutase-like phosphatase (HAD superfamily)
MSFIATALLGSPQRDPQEQERTLPPLPNPEEDHKLPNGKSQKDEIARQNHEQSLKDANDLVAAAEELRDELQKSGNFVVSVSSVKKTEEIERLAKRIRGRLKY